MFYKFKEGKQKELIQKAIIKAGSERKLSRDINIPNGSIYSLKFEKRNLSDEKLKKILSFLKLEVEDIKGNVLELLPDNWGRIKGGKNLIKKKIKENMLANTIQKLKKASSIRMKKWHKDMKKNEPKKYYVWQYERFKKIGRGYNFKLKNGIQVRNELERTLGNFLVENKFKFEYEPYLNINGSAYFPDFLINNKVILEVTEWKHPTVCKLKYLKEKIKGYEKENYKIVLFVPPNIRKFYKELDSFVISDLQNLGDILMPP